MIYESARKYTAPLTLEDQAIFAKIKGLYSQRVKNLYQAQDERDALDMMMRRDLNPPSGIWKLST